MAIEQLNEQRNHWAFLAAVITNGFGAITSMFSKRKHKAVSPDDFMGKDAKKCSSNCWGKSRSRRIGAGILRRRRLRGWRGRGSIFFLFLFSATEVI